METNKKKAYQKPQLQEVKLVPEEAVLAACKTATNAKNRATGSCNAGGCRASTTVGS